MFPSKYQANLKPSQKTAKKNIWIRCISITSWSIVLLQQAFRMYAFINTLPSHVQSAHSLARTFLLLFFILESLDEGVGDRGFRIHLQRRVQQGKVFLRLIPEFPCSASKGVHFTVLCIFGNGLTSRLPGALRKWYGNQFYLRVLNVNDKWSTMDGLGFIKTDNGKKMVKQKIM